jgi:hypothetical protein
MTDREQVYYMTQGSRNPALKAYLRDAEGNVPSQDLMDADTDNTLTFFMRTQHGDVTVIDDAPALLVDSITGEVWYEWSADDELLDDNVYLAKFHMIVDGKQAFFPQKDHIKVVVSKK